MSYFIVSVCGQVCYQYLGTNGGRRLHDRLPEWCHTSQEDAWLYLDEKMLPNDRQKVTVYLNIV